MSLIKFQDYKTTYLANIQRLYIPCYNLGTNTLLICTRKGEVQWCTAKKRWCPDIRFSTAGISEIGRVCWSICFDFIYQCIIRKNFLNRVITWECVLSFAPYMKECGDLFASKNSALQQSHDKVDFHVLFQDKPRSLSFTTNTFASTQLSLSIYCPFSFF